MCETSRGWLWLLLISSLLSVLGGSLLAVCCLRLWRRQQQRLLLTQQLLLLGVSDALLGCWTAWMNAGVLFFNLRWLSWCAVFVFVDKWLLMLSVLFSLTLAVGLVARLRRKPMPLVLWHTWWLVPTLSLVLNLGYLVWPGHFDVSYAELCVSDRMASTVNAIEIVVLFVCIVVVHIRLVAQICGSAPHSVIRRAVCNASKYFWSFLLTYVLYVLYYICRWVDPTFDTDDSESCFWYNWRNWSQLTSQLNGLFNALAFCSFLCRMKHGQRRDLVVAFTPTHEVDLERSTERASPSRRAARRHRHENLALFGVALVDARDAPRAGRARARTRSLPGSDADMDTPLASQHGASADPIVAPHADEELKPHDPSWSTTSCAALGAVAFASSSHSAAAPTLHTAD